MAGCVTYQAGAKNIGPFVNFLPGMTNMFSCQEASQGQQLAGYICLAIPNQAQSSGVFITIDAKFHFIGRNPFGVVQVPRPVTTTADFEELKQEDVVSTIRRLLN